MRQIDLCYHHQHHHAKANFFAFFVKIITKQRAFTEVYQTVTILNRRSLFKWTFNQVKGVSWFRIIVLYVYLTIGVDQTGRNATLLLYHLFPELCLVAKRLIYNDTIKFTYLSLSSSRWHKKKTRPTTSIRRSMKTPVTYV